jgi:Fic family protein
MAKANGAKTEPVITEDTIADSAEVEEVITPPAQPAPTVEAPDSQDIEESLNALKTLLSAVEKLQKVRQEVGDIKPSLIRMLDGEILTGEELEQLKLGVGGLFKLVRAHSDHQTALANAQPARALLDQVLRSSGR